MSARPRHFSSRSSGPLALALLLLACGPKASVPPDQTPAAPSPNDPSASAPADAAVGTAARCPSWGDLDVDGLEPLPPTPYTPTLEKVWLTVLTKHYDPTVNCLDWPAIRLEYGAKLTDANDEAEAFDIMREMLGHLGQSHLGLVPPRTEVAGEPRAPAKPGGARAPLAIRVLDGRAIVVDPALHGHPSGVPGGAEVLAIDDHELAPLLTDWREHYDREVEATFATRQVVDRWLSCASGERRSIRYIPHGGSTPKTRKVRCRPLEGDRVSLGNLKNIRVAVQHRMMPSTTVGYLHFNVWMVPLVPQIEAAVSELRAQGMTSLIIDLRGNPGGVGHMVVPVGRLVLSESVSLGTMRMRQSTQTFSVTAGDDPFTGAIALLVDEGTASTSEIFAQALKDLGRARVYGAVPSQGAALPSVIETLPGGGIFQFVVADYQSPAGTAVEGRGVAPDTLVPETREDFAHGRDPVLDAALADLTGA